MAVVVHSAGVQDFHGVRLLLTRLAQSTWPRLNKVLVDAIYKGDRFLAAWIKNTFWGEIEVVEQEPSSKGFQVLPKRWVVERTFAWLGRNRRLSKDFELHPATSETWVYIAMLALLARRLALNP